MLVHESAHVCAHSPVLPTCSDALCVDHSIICNATLSYGSRMLRDVSFTLSGPSQNSEVSYFCIMSIANGYLLASNRPINYILH